MKVTREMVLKAERCTAMMSGSEPPVMEMIHVVPEGDYEQRVLCFNCLGGKWGTKSQDSYWSYYDSRLMLTYLHFFDSNKEALEVLEAVHAFDDPKVYGKE